MSAVNSSMWQLRAALPEPRCESTRLSDLIIYY